MGPDARRLVERGAEKPLLGSPTTHHMTSGLSVSSYARLSQSNLSSTAKIPSNASADGCWTATSPTFGSIRLLSIKPEYARADRGSVARLDMAQMLAPSVDRFRRFPDTKHQDIAAAIPARRQS